MWEWPAFPPTTAEFEFGDVVSTSQPQGNLIDALAVPAMDDDPYTVRLNYGDGDRDFTYLGQTGESLLEVTAGLAAVLLEEQTFLDVITDDVTPTVLVQGPLIPEPRSFTLTPLTANLDVMLGQDAVVGPIPGDLRILEARRIWTRDNASKEARELTSIKARRRFAGDTNTTVSQLIGTDTIVDLTSDDVRTFISKRAERP